MGIFLKSFIRICKGKIRHMSSWSSNRDLFEYTSGRFLFNEELRLAERRVHFDVDALVSAVCRSENRPVSDLSSLSKLAEGGYNRVLQTTFKDGYTVLIKIPYTTTVPKRLTTASEVATLDLLRCNGLPVPKVLDYSADHTNPVGAEYIVLEKLEGKPLGEIWYSMKTKLWPGIMKQIVALESKFMNIPIPASGSLYYRRDLEQTQLNIPLPGQLNVPASDQIVVGPTAQYTWWYQERKLLEVDSGPWKSYLACFEAPAKRELEYCKRFGNPRFHAERYLRQLHDFKEISPTNHINLLSDYLKMAPYLDVPSDHPLARPTLRHPDFSPNNIFVDSSYNITGIIDWQHVIVLPLCLCAEIPHYFQNWGDPESETLTKPDIKAPKNYNKLSEYEQLEVQETMRKRIVHFYYAAMTMQQAPDHFNALSDATSMLRAQLFNCAGAPWEGDSLNLKYTISQVCSRWPMPIGTGNYWPGPVGYCPVRYSEEECRKDMEQKEEAMQKLTFMRDAIGIDSQGWVPDDEHLEKARGMAQHIKQAMLEHSGIERTAALNHFPFEHHDEGTSDID